MFALVPLTLLFLCSMIFLNIAYKFAYDTNVQPRYDIWQSKIDFSKSHNLRTVYEAPWFIICKFVPREVQGASDSLLESKNFALLWL